MKFKDTIFWNHYTDYQAVVKESRMRSTVDALVLWKLCQFYKFNNILEIGVHQGLTTGLLLEANPEAKVTGIDPIEKLELLHKHYQKEIKRFTFVRNRSQILERALDPGFDCAQK